VSLHCLASPSTSCEVWRPEPYAPNKLPILGSHWPPAVDINMPLVMDAEGLESRARSTDTPCILARLKVTHDRSHLAHGQHDDRGVQRNTSSVKRQPREASMFAIVLCRPPLAVMAAQIVILPLGRKDFSVTRADGRAHAARVVLDEPMLDRDLGPRSRAGCRAPRDESRRSTRLHSQSPANSIAGL
jgi:hypothetical protein